MERSYLNIFQLIVVRSSVTKVRVERVKFWGPEPRVLAQVLPLLRSTLATLEHIFFVKNSSYLDCMVVWPRGAFKILCAQVSP